MDVRSVRVSFVRFASYLYMSGFVNLMAKKKAKKKPKSKRWPKY